MGALELLLADGRFPGDPATLAVFDFLPDVLLHLFSNDGDFAEIYTMDKWVANADARQKDCSEARARLVAMQDGQRVARFAENGERVVLDDTEHEAEIERLSKYVARNCK